MTKPIYIPHFGDSLTTKLIEELSKDPGFKIFTSLDSLDLKKKELFEQLNLSATIIKINDIWSYDIHNVVFSINSALISDPTSTTAYNYFNFLRKSCSTISDNKDIKTVLLSSLASNDRSSKNKINLYYEIEKIIINSLCPFTIFRSDFIFGFQSDCLHFFKALYDFTPFYPRLVSQSNQYNPIHIDYLVKTIGNCIQHDLYQDEIVNLSNAQSFALQDIFSFFDQQRPKKKIKWKIPSYFENYYLGRLKDHCNEKNINYDYLHYLETNSFQAGSFSYKLSDNSTLSCRD